MKILIEPGAHIPTKAHEEDAGFDIMSPYNVTVPKRGSAVIDVGVHIAIPKGLVGFLKSKSGLNVKHDITSEGVIDSGYTGSIKIKLYNHGDNDYEVKAGDKITQIIFLAIPQDVTFEMVDKLEDTERGENGFGSSGR